jgi:hypothetical protein
MKPPHDMPQQPGPVRLVVGFRFILLLVENCPGIGCVVLDYYSLIDESDRNLLMGVRQLETVGWTFGRGDEYHIKSCIAPAMFSPAGADDSEAKAAMARLAAHGLPTSNEIVRIDDPHFEQLADGRRERKRRRRSKNQQ